MAGRRADGQGVVGGQGGVGGGVAESPCPHGAGGAEQGVRAHGGRVAGGGGQGALQGA